MDRSLRNTGGAWPTAVSAAALMLALVSTRLAAQSVSEYRLPGSETPRPRVQGPVDPDNPVVPGPAIRPSATPAPAPAATTASPSPSVAASPPPRAAQPAQPRPSPSQTRPAPAAASPDTPVAGPAAPPSLPIPSTAPSAFPTPLPQFSGAPAPAPAEAAVDAGQGWPWPWIGGGAALLAALGGLLWWRRRRAPLDLELEFEPPVVAKPEPAPKSKSPAKPAPPVAERPASDLGIALEARRMNASLMATTLSYTITLTNHSAQPLSALAIEGDMVSAHASLPPEQQIASSADRLELRHALVTLAAGESAEFTGDFRLPLTAITPIRAGDAAYFVPLARLRVEASTLGGDPLVEAQTFVVGELPERDGAALRPFRLDLGPRNYMRVSQRAVN
jgi:hypothetical protein